MSKNSHRLDIEDWDRFCPGYAVSHGVGQKILGLVDDMLTVEEDSIDELVQKIRETLEGDLVIPVTDEILEREITHAVWSIEEPETFVTFALSSRR